VEPAYVKVTLYLTKASISVCEKLAQKRRLEMPDGLPEVLTEAIYLQDQLDKEVSQGAKILIWEDSNFRELEY
jgi:hypothetical protein